MKKEEDKKQEEIAEGDKADMPYVYRLLSKQETYENWVSWQKKIQGSFDQIIFTSIGRDTYFKKAA